MGSRRGQMGRHQLTHNVTGQVEHEQLKKRLQEIWEFRKNYEQLRDVIQKVFKAEHGEQSDVEKLALSEISSAYSNVIPVDILEMRQEGKDN